MLAAHILIQLFCLLSPEESIRSVYHQASGTGQVFRLGPFRAVTLQRAKQPEGFRLTLQLRPGSSPCSLASFPLNLGFGLPDVAARAQPGTFSVDGVALMDRAPQNARQIFRSRVLDSTGMFLPVSGVLLDAEGRVRVSQGSRLRYRGHLLASRMQKEDELTDSLGRPDFSRCSMDMGSEAPLVLNYYFRENCVVEVGIVNDTYLQNHCPAMLRGFWSGRICRFRIWSNG